MHAMIASVLAVVLGASPSPRAAAPHRPERIAELSRGACEGTCPVYKVAVYSDGSVEYEGQVFVKVIGKARGQLSPADLARLRQAFADAHFLEIHGTFEDGPTDAEFVDTFYRSGNRTNAVHHYALSSSAPKALITMEERFDEIVGSVRWVGTSEERDRVIHSLK